MTASKPGPDNMMTCASCGIQAPKMYSYLTFTWVHKPKGKNLVPPKGLCAKCIEGPFFNKSLYYCIGCEDFYVPTKAWAVVPGKRVSHLVCPSHSVDKSQPVLKCVVCSKATSYFGGFVSRRGQFFCAEHYSLSYQCAAPYCGTTLHPDQPGVVKSTAGKHMYCADCADVRTVPFGVPMGWHPLTWEYKPGCPCSACSYLAGKNAQWPVYTEPVDMWATVSCCYCDRAGHMSYFTGLEYNKWSCHCCTFKATRKCKECKQAKPFELFHAGVQDICMPCLGEKGYWLCEVQCNAWFPKDKICNCQGVYRYDYSPDPKFHWSTTQRKNPDRTPLLGLELEVEYPSGWEKCKKTGSGDLAFKAKGVKIVKEIMGDSAYVVHDGSLLGFKNGNGTGGEYGFEVVTHPFTFEWLRENWDRFEKLARTLSSEGWRAWEGRRCGLHVHISRKPMTDLHQMKFIRFIFGSTNLCMAIGQRDYKDPNLQKFAPFDKDERANFILKIRNHKNPNVEGHYTALNALKKSTYEGRWFRGTLAPESIRKNIEFMHSVWEFTRIFGHKSANEYNYIRWLRESPQSGHYKTLLNYIDTHYITPQWRGVNG